MRQFRNIATVMLSKLSVPYLLAAAAVLALPVVVAARDWTEIRFGVDPVSKPFTYVSDEGHLVGFDMEIANALCAEMKAHCSFVEQNWDGLIPALKARKFDAVLPGMMITEERRRTIDFTDVYYKVPTRIVAHANSGPGTPASLKDKRVGALRGSVQERYVNVVLAPAGAVAVSYDNEQQMFLDLKSGRIDATVIVGPDADEQFLKTADGRGFGFVGPALNDSKVFGPGAGIALRQTDPDLRDRLNAAIKAIRANGTYKKINDKYFSFDIYGG